jgi:ATP-dependent RNA helicase DDX42
VDDPAMPPLQTLHGDKHPSDRKAALRSFTKGQIKLLIATDVAGRGLDIPQVATVINFDPAKNWDTHVHRIGRAGRLSDEGQQEGSAYTLLTPMNIDFAQQLLQAYQREGRDIGEDVIRLANRPKQQDKKFATGRTQSSRVGLGFSSGHENSDSQPIKKSRWS